MKTKEKLERAGWVFKEKFGYSAEIYARDDIRVLYDKETDEIFGFYITTSKQLLQKPDAYQLDLFFEKE